MCNCKDYMRTGKTVIARRQYRDGQADMVSALEKGRKGGYYVSGSLDIDIKSMIEGIHTMGRVWVSRGAYVRVKRSGVDGVWYYELTDLPPMIGDNFLAL